MLHTLPQLVGRHILTADTSVHFDPTPNPTEPNFEGIEISRVIDDDRALGSGSMLQLGIHNVDAQQVEAMLKPMGHLNLSEIMALCLQSASFEAQGLRTLLAHLPFLAYATITEISPDGLEGGWGLREFQQTRNLRSLVCRAESGSGWITNAHLHLLRGLPLETLDLSNQRVGNRDLPVTASTFPALRTLILEGVTAMDDEGLTTICGNLKLRSLSLRYTKVSGSDASFGDFVRLYDLQELLLAYTLVDDTAIGNLAGAYLPLCNLELDGTLITGECVPNLIQIAERGGECLSRLSFGGTELSKDATACAELRRSLPPGCIISGPENPV